MSRASNRRSRIPPMTTHRILDTSRQHPLDREQERLTSNTMAKTHQSCRFRCAGHRWGGEYITVIVVVLSLFDRQDAHFVAHRFKGQGFGYLGLGGCD